MTTTIKSYYYTVATRVAMRKGTNNPLWLLGDHLGSTSRVVNYDGQSMHSEQLYKPWGEKRYPTGAPTLPTTYQFTGQRHEKGLGSAGGEGLYYYGARWYDPLMGRFITPDPIIPGIGEGNNPNGIGYVPQGNYSSLVVDYHETKFLEQLNYENNSKLQDQNLMQPPVPKNVLAFDRYAYTLNNPVKYNDPSGHCIWDLCIVEGIGIIEITILAITTFATLEATQPGRPEAFAQTIVDIGQQASQRISNIFTQYRYRGDERTAGEIIGQEKKGSINREFPSEMLGKTADEINRLAREGNRAAQKAQKLLSDQRFDKHKKRVGKG